MKNVLLFVLLLCFCFRFVISLKCPSDEKCLCLPGQDSEFQCPFNDSDIAEFVIHIKDQQILIDCAAGLERFNIHNLPNITIDRIDSFKLRFCPLPEHGFKEVFDSFSLSYVKFLQYDSYGLGNTTLTKEYFKDLEFLDSLQLNSDEIVHLEEDVFANTPNLTSLELQGNAVILEPNLFQYTPKLKSLDLSMNGLQSIPRGIFQNLEKLELLHLWSNNLTSIDEFVFNGLTNLKSLELSFNKIETISEGAFKSLTNLSRLNLSSNNLKTLVSTIFSHNTKLELIRLKTNPLVVPDFLLANLPKLKQVDLSDCKLETLPKNVFQNSRKIKVVHLGTNNLTNLSEGFFRNLPRLEEIDLSNNNFEKIGNMFVTLDKLKILDLHKNQIGEIEQSDFKDLTKLETINLSCNKIRTINNYAFQNNDKLKVIDLSNNSYAEETDFPVILLENVPSLESVDLSHNRITQIENVITLYNKVYLKTLDMSYNQITNITLKDLRPLVKKLTINLKHNNISTVNFALIDIITEEVKDAFSEVDQPYSSIFLGNNPLDCNCYNYDLVRYFQNDLSPRVRVMFDIKSEDLFCKSPPVLENMPVESVPQELLTCSFKEINEESSCSKNCSCFWRPFDDSLIFDFSNSDLTEVPEIDSSQMMVKFNQTEVHLEGNRLTQGPNQNSTGYHNVTKLFLSNNEIERVTWLPPHLEVVRLDNNKIRYLGYEVLDALNSSSLVNLTLDNNPWSCDCEAANLTNFLRQHTKVVDARYIRCFNTSLRLIDLNRNDLCRQTQIIYAIVPVLGVLLVAALLLVAYYRHQQSLKVWLYAHNLCLWWVTEEELDKDKMYDAFISYSHKDEEFVVQNLLPVLEGGPNPYKLCLHYRNWIPGEFISTQVTNSVLESRRTLVVLSPNFLESVWGKMEFRTAHTQAMAEGRARVIILLYGDVEIDSLDEELKSYLKTNTYVKWGDQYFWNKLKYALPHSKRNMNNNNNQKIANVMNSIDDKFNLVTPVTSSPGTTPPVLSLDIKKHPLNFVPSDLDTPPAESGTLLVSTCL